MSFTDQEVMEARRVRAMDIKKVVDDAEWQVIRKSLIGNWIKNHRTNVETLRTYFENKSRDPLAVRRLLNVLTGSVHRTGKTHGQVETDLLRRDVRIHWKNMLNEEYDTSSEKYITGVI